jgi:hypothetical protein
MNVNPAKLDVSLQLNALVPQVKKIHSTPSGLTAYFCIQQISAKLRVNSLLKRLIAVYTADCKATAKLPDQCLIRYSKSDVVLPLLKKGSKT